MPPGGTFCATATARGQELFLEGTMPMKTLGKSRGNGAAAGVTPPMPGSGTPVPTSYSPKAGPPHRKRSGTRASGKVSTSSLYISYEKLRSVTESYEKLRTAMKMNRFFFQAGRCLYVAS